MTGQPAGAAGTSDDRRRRDTRDRLVRVATGLFRRRGVTGAGVAEICARAGVTKGVFAHHFPGGKEELAVAVIARNAADVRLSFLTPGPGRPGELSGAVGDFFGSYAALLRAKGTDFGCPVAAGVVDASEPSPAVRRAAREAFAGWREAVRALPGAPADVPAIDELVIAALEGAILIARAEQDPAALDRVGQALARLLRARSAPGLTR